MRRIGGLLVVLVILILPFSVASGATPDELRQAIDEKTKELQVITNDIKQTQAQLEKVEEEKRTLSRDIKGINYTINQLNLNIRSSEVNIEKLKLELELLEGKRVGTEQGIESQKEAIAQVLREIQQKDSEDLIHVLLKGNSLAESLLEMQSLEDLQANLSINVNTLTNLNNDLKQTIQESAGTKNKLEIENANFKNRKVIAGDKKSEKNTLLSSTKNKESVYQKQLDDLLDKQLAIGKEVDDLESSLRATFDPNVLPVKRSGVLAYPILNPKITQGYGNTPFAKKAYKSGFHNGVDFGMPIGTPVAASLEGTVIAVGDNGRVQYGKYIVIKHENNLATLYAHLSRQSVTTGDYVKTGQIIGYSGNTGYTTGPHLHLTLYWAPNIDSIQLKSFPGAGIVPVGVTVNPLDYL